MLRHFSVMERQEGGDGNGRESQEGDQEGWQEEEIEASSVAQIIARP